ncbi:hypothetical protein SISNIDRAFT_386389, partial [Sistotremastrum niveocremeum HHB9708]
LSSIRPSDNRTSQKLLGIADSVYVISLPRRLDRRHDIEQLSWALEFPVDWINATDFKEEGPGKGKEIINDLMERVRWQRFGRIDEREAREGDKPKNREEKGHWIENAFPFGWARDAIEYRHYPSDGEVGVSGADYWDMDNDEAREWRQMNPLPTLSVVERDELMPCSSAENKINMKTKLTKAMISCCHSHMLALREVIRKKDEVAIIFEDDVDLEWNVERILRHTWQRIPGDWDIVYLGKLFAIHADGMLILTIGHCYSREHLGTLVRRTSSLRQSTYPLCTHAYVVNYRSARMLYRFLRSADYAYTRPIDHALRELQLIQSSKIKSYSFSPPVAIQIKKGKSDIVGVAEVGWRNREDLSDSTMERVAMFERV